MISRPYKMNSSFKIYGKSLNFVPRRTRFIVQHASPLPVTPPGQEQRPPTDKQIFQKYTNIRNTMTEKMPSAKIILIKNVDGIGKAGEIVTVRSHMLREFYFPSGSAVYASPYNIEKYSKLKDQHDELTIEPHIKMGVGRHLYDLANYLNSKAVPVYVALENNWTLEKWHVKMALEMHDVVTNENQIILNPDALLNGPNMRLQNLLFRFYILVNKKVIVPCFGRLQHVTTKTFKQMLTPTLPDPTTLNEEECRKNGLIEEDVFVKTDVSNLNSLNDAEIWRLMQENMEIKKKPLHNLIRRKPDYKASKSADFKFECLEMETNPVLISRRQRAAMDAETKQRRQKEIARLRQQSFDLPQKLDPWDEREFALALQRKRRNRYWDDDLDNWQLPLGKF
uniref:Large ribosomal subunit protein bL9m n=1 Tax=Romanomermis culicivorax TaxID=13658 RepID=A0A915L1S5_ROMCU